MSAHYQISGATSAAISASIESGVRGGGLPSGALLPPVRGLAEELGVSPGTVAKAYQALRHRGVVETSGRNGTRVRARPAVVAARVGGRPPVPSGVRDLSSGEPDPRLLPDLGAALRHLATARPRPLGYAGAGVLPELAELARDRFAADGVRHAEVTVTAGALDGIERLLTAHLRPGDRVAVEDPSWANLLDLLAALGLPPVGMPVDDEGPTVEGLRAALAAGASAVVVTTRAQNPTGARVTHRRAAALRTVLSGHPDVLVVEDDHAAELSAEPLHTLFGATPAWALVRSVSKPYGPDLRVAALAGDEATVARVVGRMRLGAGWVSTLLQALVVGLWRDRAATDLVRRARGEYDERRALLLAELAERGLTAQGRTGINVWLPVPPGPAGETAAVTRLREEGYAVAPGALYRLASPPAIRITVSSLLPHEIPALADAVRRALTPTRTFTA